MKRKTLSAAETVSAPVSKKACNRIRTISEETGLSTNYVLTVVFENLDEIAKDGAVEKTIAAFAAQYCA